MSDGLRASSAHVYELIVAGETPGVQFIEADRTMAQYIAEHHENTLQSMRLNRLFMEVAANAYRTAGIRRYLDIGAGLPTKGALHELVADGDPVLYVDSDSRTATYGQQLLADRPHLRYIQTRLEETASILEEAERLFGGERLVGISALSMVHFVSDDALQQSLRQLYDWSAPGSMLAITSTRGESSTDFATTREEYQQKTGLPVNLRSRGELTALAEPWQVITIAPLEQAIEELLGTTLVAEKHRGWLGYGALFRKP